MRKLLTLNNAVLSVHFNVSNRFLFEVDYGYTFVSKLQFLTTDVSNCALNIDHQTKYAEPHCININKYYIIIL